MSSLVKALTRVLKRCLPAAAACSVHTRTSPETEETYKLVPGSRTNCTLIPGDGVGPELVKALQDVFHAAKVPVNFELYPISEVNPVPHIKFSDVKASILKNKVCIKGTLDRTEQGYRGRVKTLNMKFLDELDLFASVVHVRSFPGVNTRHKGINAVIIRESTEGEYSALEHECVPGVVECLKIITAYKSKRIAKFAFDYAVRHNRKKVTAVHKANIMKLGDGLFLNSCQQVAQLYPRIKFEKMIVDNATMQLVSNPKQFDVMVTPNLYGNIVNNLAAGLVGGAGVVPGAAYSSEAVVFEPGAHHTFAGAAGKKVANPTAMLLCGVKLLNHINLQNYSKIISNAVYKVLMDGKVKTKDLGGESNSEEYVRAVIENIQQDS